MIKDLIQRGYDLSVLLASFAAKSSDTSYKLWAKDAIEAWDKAASDLCGKRELEAAASVAQRMQREPTVDHPSYE